MKRLGVCFLITAIAAISLAAQDYTGRARVFGVVFDEAGQPIEGVKIAFYFPKTESGFEVVSDKKGEWKGSWIKGGTWYIDFSKSGFETKKITLEVQEYKKNPEITIQLKKAPEGQGIAFSDEVKNELLKGNAFFGEGKYEEAAGIFKGILETNPDLSIINLSVGNCYFQMNDYDQAEAYYQKILEKEPQNIDAILAIGNCYQNRGDEAKALEWYAKLDFEKITDPVVLFNIGTSLFRSSKFEEALKYYKRSTEIKTDFLDGIYQSGLAYLSLNQKENSLAEFERYLKIDSNSPRADQVRSFIEYLKKQSSG